MFGSNTAATIDNDTGIPAISPKDYARLTAFIYRACGIKLLPAKKGMLTARLHKRLKALGMKEFKQYVEFIETAAGQKDELVLMINSVSTNKTDFFREPTHFDYLCNETLPVLERKFGSQHKINVWSAGCSSGEEPYTLAMVLTEYATHRSGINFQITGTDISTKVLDIAARAVYPEHIIEPISGYLRHKYLMRGKGEQSGKYRFTPEIRSLITFRRLNFMDNDLGMKAVDVIFCRNVIIYFDRATQTELFRKFYNAMSPGGYLFIGHSETLDGVSDKFVRVAPTVYRRPE